MSAKTSILTGTATNDTSAEITFQSGEGKAGLRLKGIWVGSVDLECKEDGSSTFEPVESFDANTKKVIDIADDRDVWRLRVAGYTSGTIEGILHQSTTNT